MSAQRLFLQIGDGAPREVGVERLDGDRVRVTWMGAVAREALLDVRRVSAGHGASTWSVVPAGGGAVRQIDIDGAGPELQITLDNVTSRVRLVDARRQVAAQITRPPATGPQPVRSPMPGKVVKILVGRGDVVKAGQGVVVVEAMKMENELKSPQDGVVRDVAAREGQAVEAGFTLVTIE